LSPDGRLEGHVGKKYGIEKMKIRYLCTVLLLALSACGPAVSKPNQAALPPRPTVPNPTVPPSAVPLSPTQAVVLDGEGVRQLMLFSHTKWQSLWADAQVDYYAGDGSNTVVQSIRIQVWTVQPALMRVLRGPAQGAPAEMWVSDGYNSREPGGQISLLPPSIREPFTPPTVFSDTIYSHPLGGYVGYGLGELLFSTSLAQRPGTYTVIGSETIAGRPAILLDWSYTPGAVADRFWVDVETGVILRQQNFGKGGLQGLNSDIFIRTIQYAINPPANTFNTSSVMPESFASDYTQVP
jgi:hypothetical protein